MSAALKIFGPPPSIVERGQAASRQDLESLEAVIADGLRSFVEVGRALSTIRDGGLYREQGYKNFASYCRARWDFGRSYAYDLINSSAAVENVRNSGHDLPPPANEGQANELARLKNPEEQAEAWREALASAPESGVTAKHVADVVAKRLPPVEPKSRPVRKEREPVLEDPILSRQRGEMEGTSNYFYLLAHEVLRTKLDEDVEFAAVRSALRSVSHQSRAQRLLSFILDGGEFALIRLGLDWPTTIEEAKHGYRWRCQTAHPDRGGTAKEFDEVTKAYKLVCGFLEVA
jgi:hypothetical protein